MGSETLFFLYCLLILQSILSTCDSLKSFITCWENSGPFFVGICFLLAVTI